MMAQALPWLVRGLSAEEQASHLQTLAAMLQSTSSRENMLVFEARREAMRQGVAFAQVLPGRTALVWPLGTATDPDTATSLLNRLFEELRRRNILVAQALIDPKSTSDAQAVREAGFQQAGELVYMVAELTSPPLALPVAPLSFQTADAADPRLAQTIEATYRGSLDCPLVDGWRPMDDVLAGYRGTGTFSPELWQFACIGEQIVGCLLLSEYPEQKQGEVVYLGLCSEYRGRGWGQRLVRQALQVGRARRWEQLFLAVDEANQPARRMYSAAGFSDLVHRQVFVCHL